MNLKKIRVLLVIALVAVVSGLGGYKLGTKNVSASSTTGIYSSVDTSVMQDVLARLKKDYLKPEKIDSKKMMYGAAEGMTAALGDPYTTFLPPTNNTRTKEDLSGQFGGVGIELGFIDKTLAVMAPVKGSPAFKAGVKAGDLILKIKDVKKNISKDTTGLSVEEAVDIIRGEKGTDVILTMFREGDKQSKDVTLTRDIIDVPSTEIDWVDNGGIAWIRVNKFGEKTLDEWNKIVDEVLAKKAKGVVLDLRNNPGGYLQRAVDLASEFIADGTVVMQRNKDNTETFTVNHKGRLVGMPMVTLINKGSASASEILSGALRERLGTKLIGENSFGKGTVQEAQELPNGAGLHITIAEWLMPSGLNIHGVGLKPDVEVKYVYDEKKPLEDNQLNKAVEVLKGLAVAKK